MPTGSRPNPPAHVCHFSIQGVVDSAYPWANGFWVRNGNEDTPSVSELSDFADDIADEFKARFARVSSSRLAFSLVKALYYGPTGGDVGVDRLMTGNGTGSGDVLPANVAMCISWKVQQRYKGGHARTYLAGVDLDTQQDAASFKDTEAATCADDANSFLNNVTGMAHGGFSDAHLGVVSFVHNNQWRSPAVFRDFVAGAATVDTRMDSQRRRLGRDR